MKRATFGLGVSRVHGESGPQNFDASRSHELPCRGKRDRSLGLRQPSAAFRRLAPKRQRTGAVQILAVDRPVHWESFDERFTSPPRATAAMMTTPVTTTPQYAESSSSTSALRITAIKSAPNTAPATEPLPPVNAVPPMIADAMTYSS